MGEGGDARQKAFWREAGLIGAAGYECALSWC